MQFCCYPGVGHLYPLLRVCLHEGGGPQVGEVTCGGLPQPTCKRDHIKMRDCMDRRVTPPKRVTSPTWGLPPLCKQALSPMYSPWNDPQPWKDPQIDPEMIPTPKWSSFLFTSTPKWSPINSWNGMVFRLGTISSLLRRLRSWIAFNISLHFTRFFSRFCHLIAFMSTFASSKSF